MVRKTRKIAHPEETKSSQNKNLSIYSPHEMDDVSAYDWSETIAKPLFINPRRIIIEGWYATTQKELALEYYSKGFNVIPLWRRAKNPALKKGCVKPLFTKRMTLTDVEKAFSYIPRNMGVICGETSNNLMVYDIDHKELAEALLKTLPKTMVVQSGSQKGMHFYYWKLKTVLPSQCMDYCRNEEVAHIDIKSQKGLVVVPWSEHPSGNCYEFIHNIEPAAVEWDVIFQIMNETAMKLGFTWSKGIIEKEETKKTQIHFKQNNEAQYLIDLLPPLESMIGFSGKGPHPIHGSPKTGINLDVNSEKQTWYCWAHNVGGSKLEWYAIQKGILICEKGMKMTREQKREAFRSIKAEYQTTPGENN